MGGPLTELRNQRLPRRKMAQTYGKKKASGTSTAHRDIFGSDENSIETALESLTLEDTKTTTKTMKGPTKVTTTDLAIETKARSPVTKEQSLVTTEDAKALQPLLALSDGRVKLFTTWASNFAETFDVEKVGEGSFAEVFKMTAKPRTTAPAIPIQPAAVFKVIPLLTPCADEDNHGRLSTVESVAREVRVLDALDSIHGFTRYCGVHLVTGFWPRSFLTAFRTFRRLHGNRATNVAPDDDFDDEQIYAIVEMKDAGKEISTISKPSVFQIHDIFWMTAAQLAIAETKLGFEHRDLHLSNICVKPDPNSPSSQPASGRSTRGTTTPTLDIDHTILREMTDATRPSNKLGLSNLNVTIIDYTVSRCQLPPTTETSDPEIIYDPMSFISSLLPSLAAGGEDNEQYHCYLKMRAATQFNARNLATNTTTPNQTPDKWSMSTPRTNVIWLAYLLRTMGQRSKPTYKRFYVVKGSSKTAKALQTEMWETLEEVEDAVRGADPDDDGDSQGSREVEEKFGDAEMGRTPESAGALIALALEKAWLTRDELAAFHEKLSLEC